MYRKISLTTYTVSMNRGPVFLLAFLVLSVAAKAQYPGAQPPFENLKAGFDAVKVDDAKRILTFLATKCEGRGTGQRGFDKAARFVANEFKNIGLKPLGDNGGYFQTAEISTIQTRHAQFIGPKSIVVLDRSSIFPFHNRPSGKLTGIPIFVVYRGEKATVSASADFAGNIVFVHGDGSIPLALYPSLAKAAAIFHVQENLAQLPMVAQSPGRQWCVGDDPRKAAFNVYLGSTSDPFRGDISFEAEQRVITAAGAKAPAPVHLNQATTTDGSGSLTLEVSAAVEHGKGKNVAGYVEGSDPA